MSQTLGCIKEIATEGYLFKFIQYRSMATDEPIFGNDEKRMFDISIILKIIGVSASGALAPGPLTASSIATGARGGWKAGLRIAIGHTVVEFPLVLVIAFGLGAFFQTSWLKTTVGLAGGIFLLFFGWLTMRDAFTVKSLGVGREGAHHRSAFMVGVMLTLLNPYFIAWWIGVGSTLLVEALETVTVATVGLFYLFHVWLDYAWLIFISMLGSASRINLKAYKVVLLAISVMIFYFGLELILSITLGP
jgi:threonine/homoserine/homoserine lactone efflux protein